MKLIRIRDGIKRQMQKGFTLIELAIVLVIAGIILTGVLKGTDAINKAKVERMVADIKGLQGTILEFQKRNNRLPGDCNNDGTIQFAAVPLTRTLLSSGSTAVPDNTAGNRNTSFTTTVGTVSTTSVCVPGATTTDEDGVSVLWNEMRHSGIVDSQRLPFELAKHTSNDVMEVTWMQVGAAGAINRANVIVIYGVPVWMAEAIDAEIDGVAQYSTAGGAVGATNASTQGRVRRWDANVTGATSHDFSATTTGFDHGGLTRDDPVSISFQFDVNKLPN